MRLDNIFTRCVAVLLVNRQTLGSVFLPCLLLVCSPLLLGSETRDRSVRREFEVRLVLSSITTEICSSRLVYLNGGRDHDETFWDNLLQV